MMPQITSNYGLIREGKGHPVLKKIPVPVLEDDYVLVKTIAIALNPTDWTTIDAEGMDGTLMGCDYAGIVVKVGKNVRKQLREGDRVAGFSHGGNDAKPWTGAFAQYIVAKGDLQIRIPDNISFEAAATVTAGFITSGIALHNVLQIPWKSSGISSNDAQQILIYGGSTASGSLAIQFAKLAGCRVLTTCSPKHFDLLRKRGTDAVYDYKIPTIGKQIRADTDGKLRLVLDCVSIESSASVCAEAIGKEGGVYCNLLDIQCPRSDVESKFFLGYSASGEDYIFEGEPYKGNMQDFEFAKEWLQIAEHHWLEGKLQTHPENVKAGGLLGAIDGMQEMRNGRGPSGEKWVYLVGETKLDQLDIE